MTLSSTLGVGATTLSSLTVSGATTLTGAVSATNGSNDIRGVKLHTAAFDTITVETGLNARQALSLIAATTGGILSGAGTGTEVFKAAVEGSTTRVTATVSSGGNRTAITYNLPS